MTRVEASAERLEAENAELQAMLIGVQNDVEQLEALLAQTRATPSAAPAATTATASDALNEQAIKAWVAQQWALALANPNAAFEQPLVRWVASASAGVLGLMLLTLLMARRRRGRDKTAAELPTHWRSGNARSSNNRPDDTVVASAAQSSVDPLEQASSLIAYGQLDQAQSVLDEALGEAPESIDLRVKLLDILAMREDRAGFEAEAHVLHAQLDDEDDPRWQRVARQGRDLAGKNHPLFAITSSDTPDKE
jgi:pilus assembly protein FimV